MGKDFITWAVKIRHTQPVIHCLEENQGRLTTLFAKFLTHQDYIFHLLYIRRLFDNKFNNE